MGYFSARWDVRVQRANEVAVAAFLQGEIRFTDIDQVIDLTLKQVELSEPASLDAVQALDETAREVAQSHATRLSAAHGK